MGVYDLDSKWLLQHYGDSLLRLSGFAGVISCRPLQPQMVHPTQTPDGLLEVQLAGQEAPAFFLVEVATYPDSGVYEQVRRDALLALLDRKTLPEVVVILLAQRGKFRLEDHLELTSPLGLTRLGLRWRVIEMWDVPGRDLLALDDPGVLP